MVLLSEQNRTCYLHNVSVESCCRNQITVLLFVCGDLSLCLHLDNMQLGPSAAADLDSIKGTMTVTALAEGLLISISGSAIMSITAEMTNSLKIFHILMMSSKHKMRK